MLKIKLFIAIFGLLLLNKSNIKTIIFPKNYSVKFKIKNANIFITGCFKGLKLEYSFNEKSLNTSFFYGELAVDSINTGIDMRDRHLKKKEYFDSQKFPTISLRADKIERESGNKYKAECLINIKGIQKKITIPVIINENSKELELIGAFDLNRLNFNLGHSSIVMSNNVNVDIKVKINK